MSFRPPYAPGPHLEHRIAVACVLAALVLAGILIVKLLLPWLVGAALVAAGLWFWHRHQTQRKALHLLFYEQLEARQGRISVLEFAMVAQLTGAEARAFLDARAREFFANFEPTDTGDVLYTFHASGRQSTAAKGNSQPPLGINNGVEGSLHQQGYGREQDTVLQLSTAELAQRLDCVESELIGQRYRSTFKQWSRQRDPDSCGWGYDARGDRYFPLPKDL